ncbi:hypothetical protein [Clostridium sp. ZBS20]|uniref:hypothetical protein n=1 Tax=Clostridium sp. ZBS20 TaxID=2949966 RepID=UPI001DDA5044|nr:hypothetical protein [Clostridium sp. ZBS20]HBJ1648969.1 hypothetical protein [Clostridium botulinum]
MINEKTINKLEFKNYDIILKSLNLENNIKIPPKNIMIGIKSEFLNKEVKDKNLIVPIAVKIIGYEGKKGNKKNDLEDKLKDELLFKINIVYTVKLELENENINISNENERINKLIYFFIAPTLKETVSSLGNKIGIPGLTIPNGEK